MDAFARLVQLVERGRLWDVDFEVLSPAEQVFRAVWELSGDVDNGGFDQYFWNSSGDTAFAVVDALEAIGAHDTARVVGQANAVFPGAAPPRDRAERQALLDALSEKDHARLRGLDERFYEEPDDLTALLGDHVVRHASEIEGAAELGA